MTSLQRDVLILVIDCLRSDHISRFGYPRKTTPHLDSLSAVRFPRMISTASWTYPAVTSILTGLYPHEHKACLAKNKRTWTEVRNGEFGSLSKNIETLSEVLQHQGYSTFCQTGIKPVELAVGDRFDKVNCRHHIEGEKLVNEFLNWWNENNENKFGYIQFADLHGWNRAWNSDYRQWPKVSPFGTVEPLPCPETVEWEDSKERDQYFSNFELIYDTQLRYIDRVIGDLISRIHTDENSNPLIFICGDHGEAFGEHYQEERDLFSHHRGPPYGIAHGRNLYNESIQVPLLIIDKSRNKKIDKIISTTDIFPTVLDRLDIENKIKHKSSGVALGTGRNDRYIFSQGIGDGYSQQAVHWNDYKLLRQPYKDISLLYNLSEDPEETEPLENSNTKVFERLKDHLPEPINTVRRCNQNIDSNTQQKLEDLGYTE